MAQLELSADRREILGKNVKFLRLQNVMPLHLFGNGLESLALQSDTRQVEKVLSLAGETRLISLTIGGEGVARPVLVKGVQRRALNGELLHVDLYQVRMYEKVSVEVPIILVGEAPALREEGNSLFQELHSLLIECLPDKIPASIRVDVTDLVEAGQAKRVKDIAVDPDIEVATDEDQTIAVIVSRHEEKVEEEETEAEEEARPSESETDSDSKKNEE